MSYRADRYWWAYVVGGLTMFALALATLAVNVGDIFRSGVSAEWVRLDAFVVLIAALLLSGIATFRTSRKESGPDRWWLWIRLFALALVLFVPLVVLVSALLETSNISHRALATSLWQAAFATLIALFSLPLVAVGIYNRKQWLVRQQAIEGDVWVMPESRIMLETQDVFDVSREPLVLVWQSGPPFLPLFSLGAFCVSATALLLMMLAPLIQRIWTPSADSLAGYALSEASQESYMVALLWIPVFFVLVRMLRDRLTIIEAIDDGIRYQPLVGRVRLMRWHEMRLLEVDQSESRTGAKSRSFALYDDRHHVIFWHEWGAKSDMLQPEGITWDEMWALSRELLDVIYQRTGLTPRTFTKSLQRGVDVDSEHARRQAEEGEGVDEVDEGQDAHT